MTLSSDLLALGDAMDFFVVDAFGIAGVEAAAGTSVFSVVDLLTADLLTAGLLTAGLLVVVVVVVLMTIVVFDF